MPFNVGSDDSVDLASAARSEANRSPRPRTAPAASHYRIQGVAALVFLVSLLWPLAMGSGPAAAGPSPDSPLGDRATLEIRQPEVQWSPALADTWQSVPTRQDVQVGDRVR